MIKHIFVNFILAILLCAPLSAETKNKIAVLDFKADKQSADYAGPVRDILEVELFNTGDFEILERRRIDLVLKEHGVQNSVCFDLDCAVKVGKILMLDYAVIGSVGKLEKYTITVRFVDINKGTIAYADSGSADNEAEIEARIKAMAQKARSDFFAKKTIAVSASSCRRGYYISGIVPGLAQIKTGEKIRGWVFAGAFILSGIYTGYAVYDFKNKRNDYESLDAFDNWRAYEEKYDKSRKAYRTANIGIGITALIYLANWADVLFFNSRNCARFGCIYDISPYICRNISMAGNSAFEAGCTYRF